MPKNFSKSKKDWVSAGDRVSGSGPSKGLMLVAAVIFFIFLGIVIFLFWKPKPLAVEGLFPSGSIVFMRVDHVYEHLSEFRSSAFWHDLAKVNVPKLLEHSKINSKRIDDYNQWRSDVAGVLDHPLFKPFLGREVAIAYYAAEDNLKSEDWTGYLSGAVIATRLSSKARVAEALASYLPRWNKNAEQKMSHYKNNVITAVHLKKPNLVIYYTKLQDLLFISLDQRLLTAVIDASRHEQSSMQDDLDFNSSARSFYKAPDGILYFNLEKAKTFLLNRWEKVFKNGDQEGGGDAYRDLRKLLDGFEGIKTSGISVVIGSAIKLKMAIGFDKARLRPELATMYGCVPSDNKTLAFVPQEAVLYQWANCLDFAAYYGKLKSFAVKDKDPSQESPSPFAELEKTWGFSVDHDVLPILGREFGWFIQGVEVGGLFPVPKLTFFVSIKDQKKAEAIIKRIVTTPVTIVQAQEYQQFKINFVSIPLFTSFKPSYTVIDGYLLIATSNDLLKLSIDAYRDPAKSLRSQLVYKESAGQDTRPLNVVSFVKIGDVARQSKALVDWVDHWFSMKVKQADAEEQSIRMKIQTLKNEIQVKEQELKAAQEKFDRLERELTVLEIALGSGAVQVESTDTLSQTGPVVGDGLKSAMSSSLEEVQKKRVESANWQGQAEAFRKELAALQSQQPDLEDDLEDFDQQKKDAEDFRYYVDEVVVPLLKGMESLSSQLMTTTFGDNFIETELLLKTP